MLTNGNLSQYLQQGLAPPLFGFAAGAALPQFNPQGIFAPVGTLGATLQPGQELGPYANPWAGYGATANPAQQVVTVLAQLAQQAVLQGIATQQIGTVLHQLAQQIQAFQQIAAQSLQNRIGYGAPAGQLFSGPFSPTLVQGSQGFGLPTAASIAQNPFAQNPYAAAALSGAYGGRPIMMT
jgi:hypothetical protein